MLQSVTYFVFRFHHASKMKQSKRQLKNVSRREADLKHGEGSGMHEAEPRRGGGGALEAKARHEGGGVSEVEAWRCTVDCDVNEVEAHASMSKLEAWHDVGNGSASEEEARCGARGGDASEEEAKWIFGWSSIFPHFTVHSTKKRMGHAFRWR
jgi:hypothetical protein